MGQATRVFEETARPVTERMLAQLAPAPGETILELAAGTGVVGFAAARIVEPDGRVVLSDFSEAMVEAAGRRATELGLGNVECRILDAERLDLPAGAVDGVPCRWGYMLMGDPAAALAETHHVVRPGGRLSCAVFGDPARNPWVALPSRVLRDRGHMPPAAAGAPGILALADEGRLRGLVERAGFSAIAAEEVEFAWRLPTARTTGSSCATPRARSRWCGARGRRAAQRARGHRGARGVVHRERRDRAPGMCIVLAATAGPAPAGYPMWKVSVWPSTAIAWPVTMRAASDAR